MHYLQDFWLGLKSYGKAMRFIREHKLYWYFLFPAVLMLGIYKFGHWIKYRPISAELDNMNGIVWYLIQLMIEITAGLILMKFSKYLVVIILSPLLSHLSQKTEKILTGNKYPFDMHLLIDDVKRGVRIAVRNLMWEYFFFIIIYVVSKFGWEDPRLSPVFYLTFAIGFFYYGFSFLDYINERRRLDMDQSIMFVRKHRGLAVGIGCIYSLLILVPVDISALFSWKEIMAAPISGIGRFLLHLLLWICASAAPILAIISATIAMDDIVDLSKNEYSIKKAE